MRTWLLLLVLLWRQHGSGATDNASSSDCPGDVDDVVFNTPKLVFNTAGKHSWSMQAPNEGLRIAVTPNNMTMDPDIKLYGIVSGECRLMLVAQDYGGDYVVVPEWAKQKFNISRYFLHVTCGKPGCAYHVSLRVGDTSADGPMPISLGETKSSLAYHGEPLEYVLECGEECNGETENGIVQRLTISAWPRDASSANHLSLLVRKDKRPSTAKDGHLQALRGWFSGEVVSTRASSGKWYITVLKKHGRNPLPFLLSARLPKTLEELPLGKPTFGAASADTMAFYRFEVTEPETDIEVYITVLSGDPVVTMSHSSVNPQPTPFAAQWKAHGASDDGLIVRASDPKRKKNPTGWFHVGIYGNKDSVFSIIALAEPTSEPEPVSEAELEKAAGRDTVIISWSELYLGLPQAKSILRGRTARFLFYNQLVTPRLYVTLEQVENRAGEQPDVCMASCSPDVHYCPFLSPLPGSKSLVSSSAFSSCAAAKMLASQGGSEAVVTKPCTNCWYSILATTQANESHFRIVLGADGYAHPLVAGEAFLGNVDANDSAVEFVFDLTPQAAEMRQRAGAVLRAVLTPVYGDPGFKVVKDDKALFHSNESMRRDWELALSAESSKKSTEAISGQYYFTVWAASVHSQFRLQVFWENAMGANTLPTEGSLLGLPKLPDGKVVRGAAVNGTPDVYIFKPGQSIGNKSREATISVTTLGQEQCQLAATVVTTAEEGEEGQRVLNRLLQPPVSKAASRAHLELGHSMTYDTAQMACSSKGMRLCYGGEVCPDDHLRDGPVGKPMMGEQWVPIKDEINEWLQVGSTEQTCWSHNGKIWPGLSKAAGLGYAFWGISSEAAEWKNHVFCCEMTEPYWLIAPEQSQRYRCSLGRGKDSETPLAVLEGQPTQNPDAKDVRCETDACQKFCEAACNQAAGCTSFDFPLGREGVETTKCRLYTYTEKAEDAGSTGSQFCQLEDLHGLPLEGMVAWFKSGSAGLDWQSSAGSEVHMGKLLSGGSLSKVDEKGHGSAGAVRYIKGSKSTAFDFGEVIHDNFTICSVSRYDGPAHGRIFTGGPDWFHGHWQNSTGVARYGEWATPHHEDGRLESVQMESLSDWTVMCGTNRDQSVYVNGMNVATRATNSTGRHRLRINDDVSDDEKSDWAVMEVATWSRPLSAAEIQQASLYLMRKLQVIYLERPQDICNGVYLMQDFEAGDTELCSKKCRDIGSFCTGFIRKAGTEFDPHAKCSFFTGRVSVTRTNATLAESCWLPWLQATGQVAKDQAPKVWRTQMGQDLLNLHPSDPQASNISDDEFYGYAIAVLPAVGSIRLEYELEAASAGAVAELPATGVPVAGRVSLGAYQRYRVVVLEAGRHLAISLLLLSGDADLYVGLDASVSRENSNFSSEVVGSDSIFLPAFGAMNKAHCSQEALEKSNGECVYYVAVRGSSEHAEFRLTAMIPSGFPVEIVDGDRKRLVLPKGVWQYYMIDLIQPLQGITVQVQVQTGAVASFSAKIATLNEAKEPGTDLADFRSHADFTGRSFAGVWTTYMGEKALAELCRPVYAAHAACAVLVLVEASQALTAEVILTRDRAVPKPPEPTLHPPAPTPPTPAPAIVGSTASPTTSLAPVSSTPISPPIMRLPLEAGVPTRGILFGTAGRDVLSLEFNAQDIGKDTQGLEVMVTPLTSCKPSLTLEFPPKESNTLCSREFQSDEGLGYISVHIPKEDECFGRGMFLLTVRVAEGSPECQVDVRAQLQTPSLASSTVLLLDAPVLVSDNQTHLFLFTSRIDSATDAASRDPLSVIIVSLAGEIFVEASFLLEGQIGGKEAMLQGMRPQKPERNDGALAVFAIHGFHDHCGTSLVCQVFVRVRSVHYGGFADYQAVATDDKSRRSGAETLVPGIPIKGSISQGGHLQYQIYLNNPSAELVLLLSCGEASSCEKVILSADSRIDFPKSIEDRRWVGDGGKDGVLEIRVNPYIEQSAKVSEGSCHVPCVLFVRVEQRPEAQQGQVDFALVAAEDSMYKILLDGNDAVSVTAQPSRPEYFLFDSRQRSPLLTFVVSVPYDSADPFMELVSMYILDCAENPGEGGSEGTPVSSKQLKDPKLRPSREFHRFKGHANSRNQLVAFVSRVSETPHCYYRIAVISNRLKPVSFAIRAFDWHEGAPLPLDEPLQGMVDVSHKFSYRIETASQRQWAGEDKSPATVYLSLEVCRGKVDLQTASRGPGLPGTLEASAEPEPSMKLSGGVDLVEVNLQKNRWLKISATGPKDGSYMLLAEDPFKRVYLQPTPQNLLSVTKSSATTATLEWSPALLYGRGQPAGGAGGDAKPEAEYEVFYINVGDDANAIDEIEGNFSTPCGLFEELRLNKQAKRVRVKTQRRVTLEDLDPHSVYVFNVVARSLQTSHSVAYHPYRSLVYEVSPGGQEKADPLASGRSAFWDDIMPVLIILSSLACLCYTRPCCKAGSRSSGFEFELPGLSSRGSSRSYQPMQSNFGSYAPPSIVGTPY